MYFRERKKDTFIQCEHSVEMCPNFYKKTAGITFEGTLPHFTDEEMEGHKWSVTAPSHTAKEQ